MATSADGAVLAHLEFLERRLRDTDLRHATVLAALSEARDALERATAVVATLSYEESALRSSSSELRSEIDSQHSNLERMRRDLQGSRVRKILANFPKELLQHIFREAMFFGNQFWPDSDYDNIHDDDYNVRRCIVPFTFSAVNRRWRHVALDTADIWNRIQVPELDDRDGSLFLAYVRTLLRRSKNRDLYVLLPWTVPSDWLESEYYAKILSAIGNNAHRLRKLTMNLPLNAPESALHFLRLPLPRLEELSLMHATLGGPHLVNYPDPSFTYLPICPALRCLYNEIFFPVPSQQYLELVHLTLHVHDIPMSGVCRVLAQCPSLRVLELVVREPSDALAHAHQTSLVLPNLRVLGIYGTSSTSVQLIQCVQMPHVHELRLGDNYDVAGLAPVLDKLADTVTTLALYYVHPINFLDAEALSHIQKLHKLRHIAFRFCSYLGSDIVGALTSQDAFPNLESVTIEDPTFNDEQARYASRLMHLLHSLPSHLPERSVAFTLKAGPNDVPSWLIQQYDFLRGNGDGAAAMATYDDPSESASVQPDPGFESEEAEFTDGGSGSGCSSDTDWVDSDSLGDSEDEAES